MPPAGRHRLAIATVLATTTVACSPRPAQPVLPDDRPAVVTTAAAVETTTARVADSIAVEPAPLRAFESVDARTHARQVLQLPDNATLRGVFRGGGPARWRADGPTVGHDGVPADPRLVPVIETQGELARIVVSLHGVTLMVWVAFVDFDPQLRSHVVLASAPGRESRPELGRIELAPGQRVEVQGSEDGWTKLEVVKHGIRGWVRSDALAPVFTPGAFPIDTEGLDGRVRARARIHERPNGPTIWRFDSRPDHEVRILDDEIAKGWFLVELIEPCDDTVRITGFVRARDLTVVVPNPQAFGCGSMSVGETAKIPPDATRVALPHGTELFDDAGLLVGRAGEGNRLLRLSDGGLYVPTRWGPLPVVAEAAATPVAPAP